MEGCFLKADLRNTRTLLGLLEDGESLRRLEQLVHDVTVGLRVQCPVDVDVDALRRFVDEAVPVAARTHRIADDTLRQLARSLDRVLPWWTALPSVETLLLESRWTSPTAADGGRGSAGPVLEIRVTPDERNRLRGLQGTRDAVRARFEKYLSKHAGVETLRMVDDDGEAVFTLVANQGSIRLAG